MDFILPVPTIQSVAPLAPLVSLTPTASNQPPALNQTTVPLVDLEYGADDETQDPSSRKRAGYETHVLWWCCYGDGIVDRQ